MKGPINIWRLVVTGATFARTGALGEMLEAMRAPTSLKVAARSVSWTFAWLGKRGDKNLPPVTRAITALGPAYIKFGQILSTRPDVVGQEMALQLTHLQDSLDPFPTKIARATVERELGIKIDEVFDSFSDPIAAASIAQVHDARLKATGERVAVKVLRPKIERAFRRDLDAFHFVASVIEFFLPGTRRLRPQNVVDHFEHTVMAELDLRQEAAAASEFARNTEGDEGFVVPNVRWHLSSKQVMTMEWIEGISANDLKALRASGLDMEALGNRVLHLFLSHALRDGFFHGDMHHGNLKFLPDGNIGAIDFGIMGRIDEYTRRVYAEILYGFIKRDYKRVAEVHFEAGYVPADKDVDEFATALRAVGEPIFGMDATQISMGRLLAYLFEVTERFGMQTRTELILLQRTMVIVEGVSRSINPHINIWDVSRPVVESYISKAIGPLAAANDILTTLKVLGRFGPRLPELAEKALIAQSQPPKELDRARPLRAMGYFALGGTVALIAVAVATLL